MTSPQVIIGAGAADLRGARGTGNSAGVLISIRPDQTPLIRRGVSPNTGGSGNLQCEIVQERRDILAKAAIVREREGHMS
jgi:hypothetical protein